MNPDLPKIVDALLAERNFQGEIIWQLDQEWLAGLVVALVKEEANHLCWMNGKYGPIAEFIPSALRSFNLDPTKYAELKKRLECTEKPEGSGEI